MLRGIIKVLRYFTFSKLTYLSLKNIISPQKVVPASKVKSGPQVLGSAGSVDSVESFTSVVPHISMVLEEESDVEAYRT